MRWCPFVALLLVLRPSPAHAWVDAQVRSASARVAIDAHGSAHVVVDATLRVDGGWLEALELDGLDRGLVLDPTDPVTMAPAPDVTGSAPDPLDPTVTLREDGVLVLAFTRRHAPRRGDYVVHLAYSADLAARALRTRDGMHLTWTFPAWRHGLDSVRVELSVPPGARPVRAADEEIEIEPGEDGEGRAVWTLTRAHLARTRDWPIEIAMPEGVLAEVVGSATPPSEAQPVRAPPARAPWQGGVALALASALVALRIVRTRARERDDRVRSHPLVPLPVEARALLALALGAALMGVALVGADARALAVLAIGLVVVSVSRHAPGVLAPRLGSFRHATATLRRAARRARARRWLGIDAWLDATTVPGCALVALLAVGATRVPEAALGPSLLALALVLAALLDAARASRPAPALVTLAGLLDWARRARVSLDGPAVALMPVVHLDGKGAAQEARLRVLAAFPEGTLRADVVVARDGVFGASHALLVVAATGSLADRTLALDAAAPVVAVGITRRAYLLPLDGADLGVVVARYVEASAANALEPRCQVCARDPRDESESRRTGAAGDRALPPCGACAGQQLRDAA